MGYVPFSLVILQIELDSIGQQVNEVENIISSRGGAVQGSSVLEGLAALNTNIRKISNQTAGISLDHIESGHHEAENSIRQIHINTQSLMNRIDQIKDGLQSTDQGKVP